LVAAGTAALIAVVGALAPAIGTTGAPTSNDTVSHQAGANPAVANPVVPNPAVPNQAIASRAVANQALRYKAANPQTSSQAAQKPTGPKPGPTNAPASPAPSTVNLLTPNQTTFAAGSTGNWVGSNATLSSNGSALEVTATSPSLVSAWTALMPAGQPTVAIPGDKYTGQADVAVTNPSPSIDDALVFFNSTGTILTAVWGQVATPTASTWTTLPEIAGIAPTGTAFVGLGVMSWNAVVGQDFLVENPALSVFTTPATAPAVSGPLHTSGNQIIQANGQPVTLRGVVMPGLEQQGTLTGTGVSQRAVNEAHAWGANFIRVPLGEQFWLSSNCDYVASYMATVDQVVNWITSQGMVALLDLHTNTVGPCEAGAPHNMADEAQSPTFWSQVAQRYGNTTSPEYNPLVAFDLYNEPHNISDALWLNGGSTTDYFFPYETYQTAGMQQLYDAVRASGASNLVFISGNNWGSTPPPNLVNGNNIVYAVHYYTCPNTVANCTTSNPYDPTPVLSKWVGLGATQPIVATEFGWPSQSSGTYDANFLAYVQAQGWGWSAYAWEDRNPSMWDLTASWLSDGTAEPAPSGVPVFLALANAT
jgi:hypothetical protein